MNIKSLEQFAQQAPVNFHIVEFQADLEREKISKNIF
jgi:hypothetical protein